MNQRPSGPPTLEQLKQQVQRPSKVVVTGGMPYANGPLHLGHLAGALVPPDICARYWRMLIGSENVLFVTGNDDHGSTSELAALKAGKPVREFIDTIHEKQAATLKRYAIVPSIFSGTSQPDCYPVHCETSQEFIRKLHKNGMLEKRVSKQWFDTKLSRFLQDRFINGTCPKCSSDKAYSDQCDNCSAQYDPTELINPRSTLSDATPELRDTVHWWLDLWKVSEPLREWVQGKAKTWRASVYNEALGTVMPSLAFSNTNEPKYKEIKASLPAHKSKYAAGKKVQLQFENKAELIKGKADLAAHGIESDLVDGWAHRSISRDVAWGIPMPIDLDPDMKGKTFYVWPDSLVAPISFTKAALRQQGKDPENYAAFWKDPKARVLQFLGQDNVYFYTLMQGAMWLGSQGDPQRQPLPGEFQLTDVFGSYHLWVNGERMSKSTGNFILADQLIEEMGYAPEQVRYFLATLSLSEKNSNFDLKVLAEKSKFLAGPMNASLEKPIAACHSQFGGKVPNGKLIGKVEEETTKLVQKYLRSMERADFPVLMGLIENYARQVNSLFTQHKPHDDRHPEEERRDALYSCFYVLKNLMIMLYPFAPTIMERLRESLNLAPSVFSIDELGTPIQAGHAIGEKKVYFPPASEKTE
jgi:methionyl-tRNA synthetase